MLVDDTVAHLLLLQTTMAKYFPFNNILPEWIQHPILPDKGEDDNLNEELIDLQVNQSCLTKFRTLTLASIWCD